LETFFNIALIILSVALIAAILLQARGGGLGSILGGDPFSGQYKTKSTLEKTLRRITVGLSVAFGLLVIVNVFLFRQ
jgi:preprotein translocase subunit SecG